LYSIYLLYKGLPVLMKAPTDKAVGYTAVIVIASIVCNVVLTALFASLVPNPWSGVGAGLGRGAGSEITITTPSGQVATTQGRLEEVSRQLEAAAKKVEQASQNQDPQAVSKAASDAVAAVTGALPGGGRAPLSSDALKVWLPAVLNGLKRESFEVQGGTAMGVTGATARASYRDGDKAIDLEVLDAGGASGILAMISGLQSGERETESTHEKSYLLDKRKYTEKRWKDNQRAELMIVLTNGVMVTANARGMPLDALHSAINALGLDKLEAVQAAPAPPRKS
ncbi:MAG: YIP1 family protein, partial [Lautropia sp.]|nr:YIP1 family protein [Lautropia sp.]